MALELINPDDLPVPEMYTQVVVATGSRLVFISGQQPEDIHGKLVGHGDFAAQARLAFANLGRALRAAGARQRDPGRHGWPIRERGRRTAEVAENPSGSESDLSTPQVRALSAARVASSPRRSPLSQAAGRGDDS